MNDLDDGTECTCSKLMNGIKLEGAGPHSDIPWWTGEMGWQTPYSSTRATVESSTWVGITLCNSTDWLENKFADKELKNPLNVNQQFTLAGKLNFKHGCITKGIVTMPKEVIAQYFWAWTWITVYFWAPCFKKDIQEWVQLGVMMVQYCTRLPGARISILRDTQRQVTCSCWTCFEPNLELDDRQRSCQT